MRVIAGRLRSRKLKAVPGVDTRPTPDRLREALFNILAPRIEGTIFLDAYAGTGAVAIEALSRGAQHAILIDRGASAIAVIHENLRLLDLTAQATVVRGNVISLLRSYPCEIAFIDPPYQQTGDYAGSLEALGETGCELAIAQHPSRFALNENYGHFAKSRVLKQGDNSLSFYEKA